MSWLDYADRDGGEFAYITHGSTTISNSLIKQGGLSVDRYTASGSFLEFGNVSASELSLTLDNSDEWFDWEKGDEITVEIDRERQSTPTADNYKVGTFIIDSISKSLNTVKVVALDSMVKLDVDFDWNVQSYDITTLLNRVATICGITFNQDISSLPNYNLTVLRYECNCRTLVSNIAEVMGTCAYFNGDNELTFAWYEASTITDFTEAVRVSSNVSENSYKVVDIAIGSPQDPRVELVKDGNEWKVTMRLLTSNPIVMQNSESATLVNNIKNNCYILNTSLHGMEAVTLPYPSVEPFQVFPYIDTTKSINYLVPITNRTYGLNQNMAIKSVFNPENLTISNAFTDSGRAIVESVEERVDNLKVGGANLLIDTNAPTLAKVYAPARRYFSDATTTEVVPTMIEIADAPVNVQNGVRFVANTNTASTKRSITWYADGQVVDMVDGEEYTLSAYFRITNGTKARYCFQYGVDTYKWMNGEIEGSGWQRVSRTFRYDSSVNQGGGGARIYIGVYATYLCTVEVCGFQLERGNLATDYSPSPIEIQSQIDTIVEKTSNYFWHDTDGAHVSNVENDATTGSNTLVTSTAFQTRTGETVDASFGSETTIGHTGANQRNVRISDSLIALRNGEDSYIQMATGSNVPYVSIGKYATGEQNVRIRPTDVQFRTYNVVDASIVYDSANSTPQITLGRTGAGNRNVYLTNSTLQFRTSTTVDASFGYDGNGNPEVRLGRSGTDQQNVYISNAGVYLRSGTTATARFEYDSTNNTPKVTLGRTGSGQKNVYITNSAVQLRNGTTVIASLDSNGNFVANNAKITGDIQSGSTITGATITGSSIRSVENTTATYKDIIIIENGSVHIYNGSEDATSIGVSAYLTADHLSFGEGKSPLREARVSIDGISYAIKSPDFDGYYSNHVSSPYMYAERHRGSTTTRIWQNIFKAYESYTTGVGLWAGHVTSSSNWIEFFIPLNASPQGLTVSDITWGNISARGVNGYANGTAYLSGITWEVPYVLRNGIRVRLKKTDGTAFTNVTNNTPVTVAGSFTITFDIT